MSKDKKLKEDKKIEYKHVMYKDKKYEILQNEKNEALVEIEVDNHGLKEKRKQWISKKAIKLIE